MTTPPTFQELLTSQEARENAIPMAVNPQKCSHWMDVTGVIRRARADYSPAKPPDCIWQGYLQEAAPPEPRVFKSVRYFNFAATEFTGRGWESRKLADLAASTDRVACVRVEITAIEGVFDD